MACAVATLAAAPQAQARDQVVRSFDGTPIVTSFFPAANPGPGGRSPTVLMTHGWAGSRETNPNSGSSDSVGVGTLRRAGYNVLTWDARGFGQSGGTVMVDKPAFEGRDAQALVDFVAQQPEAQLDGPNDPRIGMTGGSYAGGIQLILAGMDQRVDAITPIIAWHSLLTSLNKDGSPKGGWGLVLAGVGVPTSLLPGILGSPAGIQAGHLDPQIYSALVNGLGLGNFSAENREFFRATGPGKELVSKIKAPTLLSQGTVDTLFTPQEAVENYRILEDNNVPVKMLWFCGGHGVCMDQRREPSRMAKGIMAWLDRYLKNDTKVDTGSAFEWEANDGVYRAAERYPVHEKGALAASGSGTLPVTPLDYLASGVLLYASRALSAVNVAIPSPQNEAEVVGEPRLSLTYSGTAAPAQTFLYAQVLNTVTGRVLGNQTTPIPVTLDGATHKIERPLEPIAGHLSPGSSYQLQVTAGTNVYAPQRSAGVARIERANITLPVVDPSHVECARQVGARKRSKRKLPVKLNAPAARVLKAARRGNGFTVGARATGRLRCVSLTLRKGSRVYARSAPVSYRGKRGLAVQLIRRRLDRGEYSLIATGRDEAGKAGRTKISLRLR